jgi:hypothetical protein
MTCQDCELKLGMGSDASEHLASCAECRWLAKELRLNAVALHEMRVRPRMNWALATAAAAIVIAVGAWKMTRVEKLALPPARIVVAQPVFVPISHKKARRQAAHGAAPQQRLRVKMFTSDPDVVIYWIVENKEGFE